MGLRERLSPWAALRPVHFSLMVRHRIRPSRQTERQAVFQTTRVSLRVIFHFSYQFTFQVHPSFVSLIWIPAAISLSRISSLSLKSLPVFALLRISNTRPITFSKALSRRLLLSSCFRPSTSNRKSENNFLSRSVSDCVRLAFPSFTELMIRAPS